MDQITSGTTITGNLSGARIANGMMNKFPCATIVDCHGNKHFSALTEKGGMMMVDMEKVIKALENCVNYSGDCINCEYIKHTACKTSLMIDALAALKEQEKLIDEITQRRANNGAFD